MTRRGVVKPRAGVVPIVIGFVVGAVTATISVTMFSAVSSHGYGSPSAARQLTSSAAPMPRRLPVGGPKDPTPSAFDADRGSTAPVGVGEQQPAAHAAAALRGPSSAGDAAALWARPPQAAPSQATAASTTTPAAAGERQLRREAWGDGSHRPLVVRFHRGHARSSDAGGGNAAAAETKPRVGVLSIAKDAHSFGGTRTAAHFLAVHVRAVDTAVAEGTALADLGILVSDAALMQTLESLVAAEAADVWSAFESVTLVLWTLEDDRGGVGRSDGARHRADVQSIRRSRLARYRNLLLAEALQPSAHWVLWIDADIEDWAPVDLLSTLTRGASAGVANTRADAAASRVPRAIVTPMCLRQGHTYDLNAWVGPRVRPSASDLRAISEGGLFVPRPVPGLTRHLDHWRGANADTVVELDSVGGTVLLVNADLHREGAVFPTAYLVGKDWENPGWDGIETEGLCWLAETIGGACFGMPGVVVNHHAS